MSVRAQRLRITYSRGSQVQYVGHLDMMRFWERVLRRSKAPISYSEGFSPHAQIAMIAPLSVGMTGRAELIDVFLAEPMQPGEFWDRLQACLPPGITIIAVEDVPLAEPSLQSQLRAVEYEITLLQELDIVGVERRIAALLAAESFPWVHRREKQSKEYDLRPLVQDLQLVRRDGRYVLIARLKAEDSGTGRADQLAAALELSDGIAHAERTALLLAPPAEVHGQH
jgi:radical SAM-linked protein